MADMLTDSGFVSVESFAGVIWQLSYRNSCSEPPDELELELTDVDGSTGTGVYDCAGCKSIAWPPGIGRSE
jgi:hypothetical protein